MLVSGVRSSCEASAMNSRCAWTTCSVSEREASSSRSIWSSVRASSPISSSRSGSGIRCDGSRVEAISRAVGGQRGDRAHGPPGDRHSGEGGEHRAAGDAEREQQPQAAHRRVEVVVVARVLDVGGRGALVIGDRQSRDVVVFRGASSRAWARPCPARAASALSTCRSSSTIRTSASLASATCARLVVLATSNGPRGRRPGADRERELAGGRRAARFGSRLGGGRSRAARRSARSR